MAIDRLREGIAADERVPMPGRRLSIDRTAKLVRERWQRMTPEQRAAVQDMVRRGFDAWAARNRASKPSVTRAVAPPTPGAEPVDPDDLAKRIASGREDQFPTDEEIDRVIADPVAGARLIELLRAEGIAELFPTPNVGPAEFWRERAEPYELRWPIKHPEAAAFPFDSLDPKTQFFVLFQEWTQCEMEGMRSLNRGDTAAAEATFHECIARARQLEVKELEARSCEGHMRVAQKRGDSVAESKWLMEAMRLRSQS